MVAVPIRTCVGCRKKRPQSELIRIARRADGSVEVATARGIGGRGAYVCRDEKCVAAALDSGRLRRALRSDEAPGPELDAAMRRQMTDRR